MEQQESLLRNQEREKLWKPRKEMERCTRFADAEQAEDWKLAWWVTGNQAKVDCEAVVKLYETGQKKGKERAEESTYNSKKA